MKNIKTLIVTSAITLAAVIFFSAPAAHSQTLLTNEVLQGAFSTPGAGGGGQLPTYYNWASLTNQYSTLLYMPVPNTNATMAFITNYSVPAGCSIFYVVNAKNGSHIWYGTNSITFSTTNTTSYRLNAYNITSPGVSQGTPIQAMASWYQ